MHVAERLVVMDLIGDLMHSMSEIRPHGRDYIGETDAYQRDLAIHQERFAVLDKLLNELRDEALAIQGDN